MPTPETITVRALRDRTDGVQWDTAYVESYWLPLVGPTSWALLRSLYRATDGYEHPIALDVEGLAGALGVAGHVVVAASRRLSMKHLIRRYDFHAFEVPTLVRFLCERDLQQLPEWLRIQHRKEHP